MTNDPREKIRQAVRNRDEADEALEIARERLRRAVIDGVASGIPVGEAAELAQVTRQAVYDWRRSDREAP